MSGPAETPVIRRYVGAHVKQPIVTPLAVFAAGRREFEVIVRSGAAANGVKALIFDELGLDRAGWDFQKSRLVLLKHAVGGGTLWRLSRTAAE